MININNTQFMQINLLPWRAESRRLQQINFNGTLIFHIILALIVVACIHWYLAYDLNQVKVINQTITTALTREKETIQKYANQSKEFLEKKNHIKFIQSIYYQNNQAIDILNELIRIVPRDIILSQITQVKNNLILLGYAKNDDTILNFVKLLANSKLFNNPVLNSINQLGETSNTNDHHHYFDITLSIRHEYENFPL